MDILLTIILVIFALDVSQSTNQHVRPKSLDTIYKEIKGYIKRFPRLASMNEIGKSFEGRPIYCVEIHDRSVRNEVTVVINFGIHAREWASQHSGVFLIRHLLTNRNLRRYIETTKWFIIPVLNPDGYYYSTTKFGMWRKNRRPLPSSKCVGVDLNRNYPVGWEKKLSAKNQWCKSVYSGPEPISEPETQTLKDLLKKISYTDAFVDVHACAQSILYPFGYTKKKPPKNQLHNLVSAAHAMKAAMKKVRGANYVVQSAADLYVAGGGTDDFAFGELKIPMVYTLELGDDVRSPRECFHPPTKKMVKLERECLQALLALSRYLVRNMASGSNLFDAPSGRSAYTNQGRTIYPPTTVVIFIVLFQVL